MDEISIVLHLILLFGACYCNEMQVTLERSIPNSENLEVITYVNAESPRVVFTLIPNCTQPEQMTVFLDRFGYDFGDNRPLNLRCFQGYVDCDLKFDSTAQQYYLPDATFSRSGNYSGQCSNADYPNKELAISVNPQILLVTNSSDMSPIVDSTFDLANSSIQSEFFFSYILDDVKSTSKLNFFVGLGYYHQSSSSLPSIGNFTYDTDVMANLTGSPNPVSTSEFKVADYPNGTFYSFVLSLDSIATEKPFECSFPLTTSVAMETGDEAADNVNVTVDVSYSPQGPVQIKLENFPNSTCQITCLPQSSCPSTLIGAEVEIVSKMKYSLSWTFDYSSSSPSLGFTLPAGICDDINSAPENSLTFTCTLSNSMGSKVATVTDQDLTVGGTFVSPYQTECSNCRSENELLWWDIFLIVLLGIFFLATVILLIIWFCSNQHDEEEEKKDPPKRVEEINTEQQQVAAVPRSQMIEFERPPQRVRYVQASFSSASTDSTSSSEHGQPHRHHHHHHQKHQSRESPQPTNQYSNAGYSPPTQVRGEIYV